MRDWSGLVRERLAGLNLTAFQQEEIVAELSGHLEDLFEVWRAQGLEESEALARALDEVPDWRRLARKIQCAKREEKNMNARTKSLWLPGLVSLAAANGLLMVFWRTGLTPQFYKQGSLIMPLHIPWLLALPFIGAAGAYLSRRAGGARLARLAAGLFPFLVLLGVSCIGFVALLISGHLFLQGIAMTVLLMIVLPGLALLLGVLPFLRAQKA